VPPTDTDTIPDLGAISLYRPFGMSFRIFVYGTLKQGYRNAHINQGVRAPGEFFTVERYPLYLIGPMVLPWLVDHPGQGESVMGELYEVDDAALARMDVLERLTEPDWYSRAEIVVRRRDDPQAKPQQALVYFGSAARLPTEVVHLGPVAEYTRAHAALFDPTVNAML
jgi:gamma-glutamylaminecyclotransferase